MLYVIPVPVGAVMVIVPVAVLHVGCAVTLAVGADGADGSLKLALTPVAEVHPLAVISMLLYVPAGAVMLAEPPLTLTPLKLPVP